MALINETPGQVSFDQSSIDFFRGCVDFKGISTRAGYWWIALWNLLLEIGALVLIFTIFNNASDVKTALIIIALLGAIPLLLLLPNLALLVRCYRDAGLATTGSIFLIITASLVCFVSFYSPCFRDNILMEIFVVAVTTIHLVVASVRTDSFLTETPNGFIRFFFRPRG